MNIYLKGAVSGFIAGLIFSVLLGAMGAFQMVAGLVGSSSSFVGFVVHMVISTVIGIIYGLIFDLMVSENYGKSVSWGLLYGAIWWILGPLIIVPIIMGMGPQLTVFGIKTNLSSLMGHLLYGFILGAVYPMFSLRVKRPRMA